MWFTVNEMEIKYLLSCIYLTLFVWVFLNPVNELLNLFIDFLLHFNFTALNL